jgi:hypothetical protein
VGYGERQGAEARLVLAEIDGQAEPVVLRRAPWPGYFMPAEFSPDDARLTHVFVGEGSASSVWDVRLDGTEARLLVSGAGGGFRSRDGKWISFGQSARDAWGRIVVQVQATDASGRLVGIPRPVATGLSSYRFSPAAPELIALRDRGLFALNPKTGTERLLARLPQGTLYPDRLSVAPDGRVALSLGVGRQSLVVVDNYGALRR